MQRHRKSWSSSSFDGALNEYTSQPCGLTPDMTCLIVLSFPAASIAWKTSSIAQRSCAYSLSCSALSRSIPCCIIAWASGFDSFFMPAVSVGSKSFRRNFLPFVTRSRSRSVFQVFFVPAPFAQASIVRPDPLARSSSMDLASLLQGYGYSVVFVGTVLEGETILALAGLAAHRGYLALPWVIAAAAAGGFLGAQIYFFVGRFYGPRVLARFPK